MSKDEMNYGAILQDARMLNSDLGRFVRKCNFSTNLSDRFYENNSMRSHKARAHRIAQMKAKRKQLERSLLMEEKKIQFLEDELRKKVHERRRDDNMKILMKLSAMKIQRHVRKMLAINRVEVMRIEGQIINYVLTFIQAAFRGKRDRSRVQNLRLQIAQHRKERLASIRIQSLRRRDIARRQLMQKRRSLVIKECNAASLIQAHFRGNASKEIVKSMRRNYAAIYIQSMCRAAIARRLRDAARIKAKTKKEKPRRIPLHERRYSIYTFDGNKDGNKDGHKDDPRRRFTELASTAQKIQQFQERTRRRTSVANLDVARNAFLNTKTTDKERSDKERSDKERSDKSMQSLPKTQVHDASSVSVSSEDDNDRIRKARLRASMRAAKLKKQSRVDEEEKVRRIEARKKELMKLEQKRRSVLEQKLMLKRQMRLHANAKSAVKGGDSSKQSTDGSSLEHEEKEAKSSSGVENPCLDESENKCREEPSSCIGCVQVPIQVDMSLTFCEDDFEDDVEENEDDLL